MIKFNLFKDVQHRPLRIFNRSAMVHNLFEDQGIGVAEEYLQALTKEERLEIAQMTLLVKKIGLPKVKELVTKGVEFVDDDYKESAA